jgi:acetyl esterase/lipase
MPSLRARLTNALLRLTTKSLWSKPGLDIARLRRLTAKSDARLGRNTPAVVTEEVEITGVKALWIGGPELAARGTLLYLHGGAWCVHLPATYRRLATELCRLTGMRVLLVDYRLAPEHPFPAGADDCLAVYGALMDAGCAQRPFAVAGDSAGGNLTLVTLMRARDQRLPLPDCAVLISPVTDLTLSGPSMRYNAEADAMFSSAASRLLPDLYCPGQAPANPLLSPPAAAAVSCGFDGNAARRCSEGPRPRTAGRHGRDDRRMAQPAARVSCAQLAAGVAPRRSRGRRLHHEPRGESRPASAARRIGAQRRSVSPRSP